MDYEGMTDLEIDRECAEKIMKWERGAGYTGIYWNEKGQEPRYLSNIKGAREKLGVAYHPSLWSPSTDRNHAATVEARIEEMGLVRKYIRWLLLELLNEKTWPQNELDLFALATATARQRCIASLLATQGTDKS